MGGYNSTRWANHHKKTRVEDCVGLEVNGLLDALGREMLSRPRKGGRSIAWTDEYSGLTAGAYVEYDSSGAFTVLRLIYRAYGWDGTPNEVVVKVELTPTETNFNGLRHWFSCPSCQSRVGKLYLPPGKLYFACRHCHDLTYRSAQTAHEPSVEDRLQRLERHVAKL